MVCPFPARQPANGWPENPAPDECTAFGCFGPMNHCLPLIVGGTLRTSMSKSTHTSANPCLLGCEAFGTPSSKEFATFRGGSDHASIEFRVDFRLAVDCDRLFHRNL